MRPPHARARRRRVRRPARGSRRPRPVGSRDQLVQRAQHNPRENHHRGDSGQHDRDQDRDLDAHQVAVVRLRSLNIAQRPRIDQRDEALDRRHDHALLNQVRVVDQTLIERRDGGRITCARVAASDPRRCRHHRTLEPGQIVGGIQRGLERAELVRSEVRRAHLRDQRLRRPVADRALAAREHAVPERAVVVARTRSTTGPNRQYLLVVARGSVGVRSPRTT